MKHGVIVLLFLTILVIAWSFWGFRKESMTTDANDLRTPTGQSPFGVSSPYYQISKAFVTASENETDENILTIDSHGHVVETDIDTVIHARPNGHCLAGGVYNASTHACDCSAGYTYSTKLGCLSDCDPYQVFVPDFFGNGGTCTNRCTDPNQYYNLHTGKCQSCPVGYQSNSNVCELMPSCPAGQIYDITGTCVSCPEGQTGNGSNQCVDLCLDYQTYHPLTGDCKNTCLSHQYMDFSSGTGKCVSCPPGYINDGYNQCVVAPECPDGMKMDSASQCVNQCLNWETYDPVRKVCAPICNVQNNAGYYTQYMDLVGSDTCKYCGPGMVGDGKNGCIQGPTLPAPTCPAGYHMNSATGVCEMKCASWRKYDLNTDSCVLRCPNVTQTWDDAVKGCVACPTGFQVDGFNHCTVGIPKAPVYNTPAPSCAPGYSMNILNQCQSDCPIYATNNVNDPYVCDIKCSARNQFWDNTHPSVCGKCTNGYLVDETNECNECDINADFIAPMFKYGTLGYSVLPDAIPGETAAGHTCQPNCAPGYLVNTDSTAAGYNTCSVCDASPNPALFIDKYALDNTTGSATQGQCVAVCHGPNVLNTTSSYDPTHPCDMCAVGYSTDILSNNPNQVQSTVDPHMRKCMPTTCDTGYVIGKDFTCSACDTANGYTNDINQVTTKAVGVTYSNTANKCFLATCPDNTALGADLTCSACASGFYGNPKDGCAPPSDDITIVNVANVKIGNMTVTSSSVTSDSFTLDVTLAVTASNYKYATATIEKQTQPLVKGSSSGQTQQKSTVTFTNVKINTSGDTMTINYYDTANTSGKAAATSTYNLVFTSNTYTSGSSIPIGTGDFAAGYLLVGGGAGGGAPTTETHTVTTTDTHTDSCRTWVGDDCLFCADLSRLPGGPPGHRRC